MAAIAVVLVLVCLAVWKKISPAKGQSNTGPRSGGPVGPVPNRVQEWQTVARKAAERYGLPWQIVLAQIWQESHGDKNARGAAGEIGLMQLKQIAIEDLVLQGYGHFVGWKVNPNENIRAGAAFLDLQRKRTGDLALALGAYNQGFKGSKDNPLLAQHYANQVLSKARKLGYNS